MDANDLVKKFNETDPREYMPDAQASECCDLLVCEIPAWEFVNSHFPTPAPRNLDYDGWPWEKPSGIYKTGSGKYIRKAH